jgi:hypothetical protein
MQNDWQYRSGDQDQQQLQSWPRRKIDVRIYDYVDSSHPILKKMFDRRCVKYRKLGYEIANG